MKNAKTETSDDQHPRPADPQTTFYAETKYTIELALWSVENEPEQAD